MARTKRGQPSDRVNADGLPAFTGVPNVGEILRRLRTQRKLSIREVAEGSGLSASFLSELERGESDVSIGRLGQIAEFFDHDLGSLLGFSAGLSRPNFIGKSERTMLNRGRGVRYELLRLPGLNLELGLMSFAPGAAFRDELTHEGIDVLICTSGEIVLRVSGIDYPMTSGECAIYSAAYPHAFRNDSGDKATAVGLTTARM